MYCLKYISAFSFHPIFNELCNSFTNSMHGISISCLKYLHDEMQFFRFKLFFFFFANLTEIMCLNTNTKFMAFEFWKFSCLCLATSSNMILWFSYTQNTLKSITYSASRTFVYTNTHRLDQQKNKHYFQAFWCTQTLMYVAKRKL